MSRKSAFINGSFKKLVTVAGLVSTALLLVAAASAQDRDSDSDNQFDGGSARHHDSVMLAANILVDRSGINTMVASV